MRFFRNIFWSLLGLGVPIILALPSMGFIARSLGIEGFGFFSLALIIAGTSSILDMGMTKAVVREVAIKKNENNVEDIKKIISTASVFVIVVGISFSLVFAVFSPFIVAWLNLSDLDKSSVQLSLILLFLSIPFILLSLVHLSYFEGVEEFSVANKLKIINGVFVATFPALFLFFLNGLVGAILGVFFSRIIGAFISTAFISKKIGISFLFYQNYFFSLIKFGGWLTVSNFISVLMQYADKFLVSNLMGAKNVSAYSSPSELVAKATLFSNAIIKVTFPALLSNDRNSSALIYKKTYLLLFISGAIICAIFYMFGGAILHLWLGSAFEERSISILKILLVGLFFNFLAQAPYAKIQANGFSRVTAIIHCCEMVPYAMLVFSLMSNFGVLGVAYAWSTRMFFDYLILEIVSRGKFGE